MTRRVVITGMGVVSPLGCERDEFWSALVEGRSGIRPVSHLPTERLSTRVLAQVLDMRMEDHFAEKQSYFLDRCAQFAVIAARAAVRDSELELDETIALEAATIVGTGGGGQTTLDDAYLKLYGEDAPRLHPLTLPRLMMNAAASHISIDLRLKGPCFAVSSACASGTHAIGQAFRMVKSGQAPVAIAGGVEACLTIGTIKAWEALRVLSADTCRPFSRNRSGLVLGEGAAMFVLEDRNDAAARGASIYAEILGFGMSADAYDMLSPDGVGAERAMRAALIEAKLDESDVDYVSAHGTGTLLNDVTETKALHRVFDGHAKTLSVSSIKGALGHGLGSAGALQIAATALALQKQVAPPTANFDKPDPQCDLDYVPNIARSALMRAALCNAFAFGGLNAVLALGRA